MLERKSVSPRTALGHSPILGMAIPIICLLRVSIREAKRQDFRKKTPLDWYNAELIKKPQDVGLWYAKGALLAKQGEHTEAIDCFGKVTELDPDHQKGWIAQAKAHFRVGSYDKSIEALDILIQMEEENETFWYQKGEALLKQGRYVEANACYEMALEIDPNYMDAWIGKGNALKGIGKEQHKDNPSKEGSGSDGGGTFNNALECFKKVLDLHPENYEALGSRGSLLCEMGEFEKGLKEIDEAIKVNPNSYEPMIQKAKALEMVGQKGGAVRVYEEILEREPIGMDPLSIDNTYWKGVAARAIGKHQSAIEHFDQILAHNPRHVKALVAKGNALSETRDREQALEIYNMALAEVPNQGPVWHRKANTQRDLGMLDDALMSYGKATTLNPQMKEAWYDRGLVNYAIENLRESMRDFLEVLQLDPSHMGASKMKDRIETRLSENVDNELEVSLRNLREKGYQRSSTMNGTARGGSAHEGGPSKEELVHKGIKLFTQERYAEALECFNQAVELDDQDYTLFEWMGDTLVKLDRYSDAIEWYDKGIKLKHCEGGPKSTDDGDKDVPKVLPGQMISNPSVQMQTALQNPSSRIARVATGERTSDSSTKGECRLGERDRTILKALVRNPRTLYEISSMCQTDKVDLFPRIEELRLNGYLVRVRTIVTLEGGTRRINMYQTDEGAYLASERL